MDDGALKRIAREIAERLPRGWSVVGDESALSLYRGVERGDVGVSDYRFWRAGQCVVVDPWQNADHSVPAAQTPDRVDRRISQRAVNVVQSVAVAARQVSGPFRRVLRDNRLPTERASVFLRARKLLWFLQWASRRNEHNARAGLERLRATIMIYWH